MKYSKYLPLFLLATFCCKSIIVGIDFASMGTILGLSSLVAFFEYKENAKIIKELSDKVLKIDSEIELLKKDNKDLHVFINATKITDAFKGSPKRF
jgi:hypothetical protein